MVGKQSISVEVSDEDRLVLASLARELGVSVPEMLGERVLAYGEGKAIDELTALAAAAKTAAQDACTIIDETLAYVRQSNARIDAMLDSEPRPAGQGA